MTMPWRVCKNNLPDYGFARSLGLTSGNDFDFKALANQLDCSRDFNHAGIIYSDGSQQWLVRPSRNIAQENKSTVTHVIVTRINAQPSAYNATKALNHTIQTPSPGKRDHLNGYFMRCGCRNGSFGCRRRCRRSNNRRGIRCCCCDYYCGNGSYSRAMFYWFRSYYPDCNRS